MEHGMNNCQDIWSTGGKQFLLLFIFLFGISCIYLLKAFIFLWFNYLTELSLLFTSSQVFFQQLPPRPRPFTALPSDVSRCHRRVMWLWIVPSTGEHGVLQPLCWAEDDEQGRHFNMLLVSMCRFESFDIDYYTEENTNSDA